MVIKEENQPEYEKKQHPERSNQKKEKRRFFGSEIKIQMYRIGSKLFYMKVIYLRFSHI